MGGDKRWNTVKYKYLTKKKNNKIAYFNYIELYNISDTKRIFVLNRGSNIC